MESPHCDRDIRYWQREVESLSNSFVGIEKYGQKNLAPKPSQVEETQLMPLNQLKQISKAMKDNMGVD